MILIIFVVEQVSSAAVRDCVTIKNTSHDVFNNIIMIWCPHGPREVTQTTFQPVPCCRKPGALYPTV